MWAETRFVGLAVVSAAVALCALLIDRPLALWIDAQFRGTTAVTVSAFILRPLDSLLFFGMLLLVIATVWRQRGSPPALVCRFVAGGAGAAVALLGALILKVALGRSQVFPPFLQDHIYGLRPFAATESFMAFPSATMAGVGAFIGGLDGARRHQRAAGAAILTTLAVALVVTSSHWLSDIIAGTYFGLFTGAGVARRLHRDKGLQPKRLQPTASAVSSLHQPEST
jgi:hypothetical protein